VYPLKRILALVCIAVSMLLAFPCQAQSGPPKRVALLIGNWDYDQNGKFDPTPSGDYIADLKNPCSDSDLVKSQLAKFGFEIHDYCNVDQATFNARVADFASSLSDLPKGSIVFLFYSGHGMQYHGHAFTVPVLFRMDHAAFRKDDDLEQFKLLQKNANNVAEMLQKLPDDKNVALVVALDKCRDVPVDEKVTYSEAVSIRTGPNTLIQYATTAGDRTPDNDGKGHSAYALVLADELSKGGDIGDIMAAVGIRVWRLYDSGKRDTYAETNVGPAFSALKFNPLKTGMSAAPRNVAATVSRKRLMVRDRYDGVTLDIFWCEGDGEQARYAFATSLARDIAMRARELGVGRVMVKPLSQDMNNNNGYNVHRNIMRYDQAYPLEREMLFKIASAYPVGNFLPQRGVGVNGQATQNYVSAFVCGRLADGRADVAALEHASGKR
jgi:hypothetical protein